MLDWRYAGMVYDISMAAFCVTAIILVLLAGYAVQRIRKYPLQKGLRLLSLLALDPRMGTRWLFREANRILSRLPRPKALDGMERIESSFSHGGRDVPLISYRPKTDKMLPCLLYFHGGGFVFESAPYLYRNMRAYADKAGCMVISVGYRTADEAPFPVPFEDCAAALEYIHRNAETLRIDRGNIAVGGDSAGGCLAAAVAIWGRGRIPIKAQFLIYPVLDSSLSTESARTMDDSPLWNSRMSRVMWELYLRDGYGDLPRLYASPLLADDLSGLPPAYIEVAEYDSLRDEGILYRQRLEAAGIHVDFLEVRGACHGFDVLSHSDIAKEAVRHRAEILNRIFS